MCNHHIMQVVREKAKSQPQFSRRNFLRGAGLSSAGLMVASAGLLKPRLAFAQDVSEVIDLTHKLNPTVPTFTNDQPTVETVVTIENDGYYIQRWSFNEHSGTHMDGPAHFSTEGDTIDNLPADAFVGPAVVIDISAKAAEDADAAVTADDLMAWEAENGELPAGAMVMMYSGWESKWDDTAAFQNTGEDGLFHFPGFALDAIEFMLAERDVKGIGVDTLSLDIGASATFDVHVTWLSAGKIGIEGVANLQALIGKQAMIVAGIPRFENGSGGPCRVLAMA